MGYRFTSHNVVLIYTECGLGEFAVEDVEPTSFSNTAFNLLTLPKDKKEVIQSLTESRVNISSFDDVIEGKGQGVIILLQ